jgi:site-specific DNA-methyltransferase (adenine-specific)
LNEKIKNFMRWSDKITVTNQDNMQLMARYPDKYFDLAIVDPPYGIGEDGLKNHSRGKKSKSKKYTPKNWDNKIASKEYFIELLRISKNVIIWGANHFIENIPNQNSSCWIIWNKLNGETDFADCEIAWTNFKSAIKIFNFTWSGFRQGDMKNKETRIHPTQKPVALYKWLLDKYAKQGDKILDTHLGSGSIAIAFHDYGFELTACELDTEYYEAAKKRFLNHSAQTKLFL